MGIFLIVLGVIFSVWLVWAVWGICTTPLSFDINSYDMDEPAVDSTWFNL